QKTFSAIYTKTFYSIKEVTSGYIVTGQLRNAPADTTRGYILKLNSSGDTIWSRIYKIFNQETYMRSINILPLNNYLVSGLSKDTASNIYKTFFAKLDTNGNYLYINLFASIKNEAFEGMNIINSNRYAFSMSHYPQNMTDTFYTKLIITNNLGTIIYSARINGVPQGYNLLKGIQLAGNGDIIFLGDAYFNAGLLKQDIYAVRTDSMLNFPPNIIGIHEINSNIPKNFKLYQNYPNPFNPTTSIKFDIPHADLVTIKIYDLLGREIFSVHEFKKAGSYEVKLDGSDFASGIYFYKIEAGNFTGSKKMVLIK